MRTGFSLEITMAKIKDTNVFVPVLRPDSGKCSIKFDQHLEALLDAQRIEDPDIQMEVCDALCALGLADSKMFTDDTLETQEHHYTSTKAMRKLAKEYLYSTKHWPIPGNR
jgi:hypothetical protein